MPKDRKPEWAPQNAGREYASRVLEARSAGSRVAKGRNATATNVKMPSVAALAEGVKAGDRTLLAKAITLIESNAPRHFEPGQELIRVLLPDAGRSIRIGVTGVPGAGKSTFIESFGLWLLEHGHKVAVFAIDPSSSLSKGSILGDKTHRHEALG